MSKTDSGGGAFEAKLELRRKVLAEVKPASVLDCFAGLGEMWRGAWCDAAQYLGIDARKLTLDEPRRRLVCDNKTALRCLDLGGFNVFDLDAYGSSFDQLTIVAARRQWKPGEGGSGVITDGTSLKLRFGSLPHSMARMAGLPTNGETPRSLRHAGALFDQALAGWLRRSGVRAVKRWQATGRGSGRGAAQMLYVAVVFEGIKP